MAVAYAVGLAQVTRRRSRPARRLGLPRQPRRHSRWTSISTRTRWRSKPVAPSAVPVALPDSYYFPLYAGLVPGYAGLYQINVLVPPVPAGGARLFGICVVESHDQRGRAILVRWRRHLCNDIKSASGAVVNETPPFGSCVVLTIRALAQTPSANAIVAMGYLYPAPVSVAPGQLITVFLAGDVQGNIEAKVLNVNAPVLQVQAARACAPSPCSTTTAVTIQIPYELGAAVPLHQSGMRDPGGGDSGDPTGGIGGWGRDHTNFSDSASGSRAIYCLRYRSSRRRRDRSHRRIPVQATSDPSRRNAGDRGDARDRQRGADRLCGRVGIDESRSGHGTGGLGCNSNFEPIRLGL